MSDAIALSLANAIVIGTGVAYLCACVFYGLAGKQGHAVMFAGYVIGNVGIYLTAKGY